MEAKKENVDKKNEKKIFKLIGNIVFYICLCFVFLLAIFSIFTRVTKGKIGSSQFLVVISSSMDGNEEDYEIKSIPVKSLIKINLIEEGKEDEFYSSLKKGDVLTFNYIPLNNVTITHRIVSDPEVLDDGVIKYELRGDAVEGEGNIQTLYSDGRTGEILGKVSSVSLVFGNMLYFVTSKVGTIVLVILPSTAICIYEISKIIYVISENKRKKREQEQLEESNKKDREIEELKRQLEEAKKN